MNCKVNILLFCCGVIFNHTAGQCPDKDSLWNRLVFLRASNIGAVVQLQELLGYERKIQACAYKADSTHALLLQRIGVMYFITGAYENAVQFTLRSIDINADRLTGRSVNYTDNIRNYSNLATIYNALGKAAEKMRALDSCIAISKRYKSLNSYYLDALAEKVEYIFYAGDYLRCISDAEVYGNICMDYATHGSKNQYQEGLGYAFKCLIWKVNALRLTKNLEPAGKALKDNFDIFHRAANKEYQGTIYMLLANIAKEKADFPEALLYYKKSFEHNLMLHFAKGCSAALENTGFLYYEKLHDYNKALMYYQKSLQFADATESLNIFDNIANVYVQKKIFDSAFLYFQRAFNEIKPGISEVDLIENSREYVTGNITEYVTGLVLDKGDAYMQRFRMKKAMSDINEAVRIYGIADRLFDFVRLTQSDLQSKLFWKSHTRRLYENAVEACFISHNTSSAFHFFERSRAMVLNDQLAQQHWLGEKDILEQSRLAKQMLRKEKELVVTTANSKAYEEIQDELYTMRQENDRLEAAIKSQNPLYYQNYLDSSSITVRIVQEKLLKDHQTLVEIFNGDSAVYAIVITTGYARLSRISKRDFDSLTNLFISYVSDAALQNKDHNGLNRVSHDLYRLIFKDNAIPNGRIIISPEGRYFPFEALLVNDDSRFFIEDHAVSYTYSARFLLNRFTNDSLGAAVNFMGVAPVQFAPASHLATLPGSEQSLNRILTFFGEGHNLVSSAATSGNFMQTFGGYRIIQMYTHASDSSANKEPVIYFADSALYLSYLLPENKPITRLIVLSACETGKGKIYQGEGVFSFNRAFATLGVPSSVSNLWSVDNGATYTLTELFLQYVSKGIALDIALQKAKLAFIKDKSKQNKLPFFWAAPILVGKTDSIIPENIVSWRSVFVIAGLIILMVLALIVWSRRMKLIAGIRRKN